MSVLFQRTTINGMKLKNRMVRSATVEGMADQDGAPTRDLFRLYERLAKGEVGLAGFIHGGLFIQKPGKAFLGGVTGGLSAITGNLTRSLFVPKT